VDISGLRLRLHHMFPAGLPTFRIREDVGVVVVPSVSGGRVDLHKCACVSVRVQHVGVAHRPVLTWQCSCQNFHQYQDHCLTADLGLYRQYPHLPSCLHEQLVARGYGGESSMLRSILGAELV